MRYCKTRLEKEGGRGHILEIGNWYLDYISCNNGTAYIRGYLSGADSENCGHYSYIYIYKTGDMQTSTLYEAHMSWLPQSVAVPIRAVEEAECTVDYLLL